MPELQWYRGIYQFFVGLFSRILVGTGLPDGDAELVAAAALVEPWATAAPVRLHHHLHHLLYTPIHQSVTSKSIN